MTCVNCGSAVLATARFCTTCGADLAIPAEVLGVRLRAVERGGSQGVARMAPLPPWEQGTHLPPPPAAPPDPWFAAAPPLTLSALAPVKLIWQQLLASRGLSAWFLLFAAASFVLLQMTAGDSDIKRAAWGFATYFALMWASAIHSLVRPERLDGWLVLRVVAACAVGGTTLAVFLEDALDPDMTQLGWTVLGVGLPEELAKAAPILLFMLLRNRSWTTRMYLYMGALSGLTFGVVEAVEYSSLYEQFAEIGAHASITTQTIWRLLADGLFHGCCAAVSAYFIGLGYWRRDRMWQLVAVGIGIAAVLHGIYDRWAANWVGTTTAVVIVALFVGYVRSGDAIPLTLAGETPVLSREPFMSGERS